jgi:HAD superfamily phosphoserine phosphatase-like hydrolase
MDKGETFLFDICGTLYYSNTTYDFLIWFHSKYDFKKYLLVKLSLSLPLKVVWVVFNKIGLDINLRKRLIYTLKGVDYKLLDSEARMFVDDILSKKKNKPIHQMLNEARGKKMSVILISASISPVVRAISNSLNLDDYIATALEVDQENKLTGKISEDIQGRKLEALKKRGLDFKNEISIATDNVEDLSLIQSCKIAVVVSKKIRIPFWRKHLAEHPNWQIIYA